MRRRAGILLIATLTAGALVVGTAGDSIAAVKKAKAPACKGKTKKKAIAAIEVAYDHFLNGTDYAGFEDKAPYIQYMSPPEESPSLIALFQASTEKNAEQAGNTNVQVNEVTCTGKNTADVDYDLVLGGTPAEGLAPPGGAILEKKSKVWKVSAEAFCNLTALGDASVLESGPCSELLLEGEPSDLES